MTISASDKWAFDLTAMLAKQGGPEALTELLQRVLTTDETRLAALQVLKRQFQSACDASNIFEQLKDCEAMLKTRIDDLPSHQSALQVLLSEGWKTGRIVHYLTDDVTVVGFHEEEGCVVIEFDDGTQEHVHALYMVDHAQEPELP